MMDNIFQIQIEYNFDDDGKGFQRKIKFLNDFSQLAEYEILNLLHKNMKKIERTIGNEIDEMLIRLMTQLADAEMNEIKRIQGIFPSKSNLFDEDGNCMLRIQD